MRKRFRSGLLALVLPVFLSVFSGCTEQVRPELDETHAKLQALQELAGAVNWDLHILDLIVKELDDGHTILPETYRLTEDGYEVSFRDGKKIVIPFGVFSDFWNCCGTTRPTRGIPRPDCRFFCISALTE